MNVPTIAPKQKYLVGLIGQGIQASRSPALHEQEALAQGFKLHYQLIDLAVGERGVADLPHLLDAAQSAGFDGLNITHPCKQAVLVYLDEIADDARAIGAVNTVVFRDGKRFGFNTDCSGFEIPFRRTLGDAPLNAAVLLGAGGAGAAVAHAAMHAGIRQLTVVDTDLRRAEALCQNLRTRFPDRTLEAANRPDEAMADADGLIHATPTGMTGHPGLPLAADLLRPDLWVAEVVYFPLETELLRTARQLGCRTLDGGGMAVWQAVGAFEHFTGVTPDAARMEAHFRQMVSGG